MIKIACSLSYAESRLKISVSISIYLFIYVCVLYTHIHKNITTREGLTGAGQWRGKREEKRMMG
jgi:hypothetical protein